MGYIDDMLLNMGVIQPHERRRIAREIRYKLAQMSNFHCDVCGDRIAVDADDFLKQMHASHLVAWADGGPNSWSNLTCLCSSCNLKQGRKSAYDAFGSIGGFRMSAQALFNGIVGPLM